MADWEDVLEIGRQLPGAEAGRWYGTAALKVAGKRLLAQHEASRG